MKKVLVKNHTVRTFNVEDGHCICTIEVSGRWVSNPTLDMLYADGWEDYVAPTPTLNDLKNEKLMELDAYDHSASVNGFILGGQTMWIVPADRTNYLNTLQGAKRLGISSVPFLGMTISVDDGIAMLDAINLYAMQCVAVTDAHRAAILALTTKKAVREYDYTVGYPTMLNFNNE